MPRGHYLIEAVKDAIWELRAEGLSEAEIGRRVGLAKRTVSNHLSRLGGVRPRARRRPERCLTLAEREEISRGIASGDSDRAIGRRLGRSHTTISREIERCGGRGRYRAHAAERAAWRRARRPRPRKLELCPELRELVLERLEQDHSPQQISGWLRLRCPDNEEMQVSHETIYRALYVQARGALRRELTRHLNPLRTTTEHPHGSRRKASASPCQAVLREASAQVPSRPEATEIGPKTIRPRSATRVGSARGRGGRRHGRLRRLPDLHLDAQRHRRRRVRVSPTVDDPCLSQGALDQSIYVTTAP